MFPYFVPSLPFVPSSTTTARFIDALILSLSLSLSLSLCFVQMRKTDKPPSEWLKLLCREWASTNEQLIASIDAKYLNYKPYLKGQLSSQLLCRLSIPESKDNGEPGSAQPPFDFWAYLGVQDNFDKAYIIAQIERFCSLYNIRGLPDNDADPQMPVAPQVVAAPVPTSATEAMFHDTLAGQVDNGTAAAAAAAGITVSPTAGVVTMPHYMPSLDPSAAAAAAAVAAVGVPDGGQGKLTKKQAAEVSKAHKMAKDAEKALENERRATLKREQRRQSQERREQRAREREAIAMRKSAERAAREATREERRQKKLAIRMEREKFALEQKNAALKRAAELVASNRVPIEITRGAAAAKAAANAALSAGSIQPVPQALDDIKKKPRSSIVVSTASDLNQIVTHSKNLWTKYNAIAKEHNQKVNWITVARELGIHVKVREKYARMHSRAEQRGFDWVKNGDWKIKDHPHIFTEPTVAEQKAKMPPPPPHPATTVLIDGSKEVVTEEVVAAAVETAVHEATSAKVAGVVDAVIPTSDEQTAAAAAVAASFVADPTAVMVDQGLSEDQKLV